MADKPLDIRADEHTSTDDYQEQLSTYFGFSNQRYESLITATQKGIWIFDDSLMTRYVNPALAQMLGYTHDDMLDTALISYLPDEKYLSDMPSVAQNADDKVQVELALLRNDGSTCWSLAEIHASYDDNGNVSEYIGLFTDITKRRQIEDDLRKSEELYRVMLDTMMEGLVLQGQDGAILAANKSAERILGLTIDQMMGRTSVDPRWRSIREDGSPFPGDQHPAMVSLATGKSIRGSIMGVYKPEGSLTWISINAQPLTDGHSDKPHAVLTTFNDITQRKAAQEATMKYNLEQERTRILTDFIQNTAHEFYTPLSSIRINIHLARKLTDASRRETKLREIEDRATEIKGLVDELLTMNRLDKPDKYDFQPHDFNQLLAEVLAPYLETMEHDIQTSLETNLPQTLLDKRLIDMALRHLVQNATQYTPPGKRIFVETIYMDDTLFFMLHDEGIGMTQEQLDHVFERFYRVDQAHSTRGFGLGLPIVERIVQIHSGTIEIASEADMGTVICVRLPIVNA